MGIISKWSQFDAFVHSILDGFYKMDYFQILFTQYIFTKLEFLLMRSAT